MSFPYQSNYSHPFPNVETTHPLIPREKTYMLDRKIVTIHSEDRDTGKWPNPNHFEIDLPEAMTQIESIRLLDSSFPTNQYVFSHNYQNTKLLFTFTMDISDQAYPVWVDISNQVFTATIEEGFYTPDDLVSEIAGKMNRVITAEMRDLSNSLDISGYTYSEFTCYYHSVKHKILFGNTRDPFSLELDIQPDYSTYTETNGCYNKNIWTQSNRWGLGAYLGFEKVAYDSGANPLNEPIVIDYADETWMTPDTNKSVHSIEAPQCLDIFGENQLYMELDKYNGIDEIQPYPTNSNAMYNAQYGGKVNSAFAKIPIIQLPYAQYFDSRNAFLNYMTVFREPLERITKLKFTFRYHDGRLIDFRNMPFSFTIEFNCLRDEVNQARYVRIPATITL